MRAVATAMAGFINFLHTNQPCILQSSQEADICQPDKKFPTHVIELYDSLPTHFPVMSLSLDKFSNVQ
jgi:hypothetical protein